MLTPQRNHHGAELLTEGHKTPQRMRLGWHLDGSDEMRSCYHLGGGAGYRSEVRIYPPLGYAIGVLGNETSYDTGAVTRMLVSAPAKEGGATDLARKHLG